MENSVISFDPECVRKKSNWSASSDKYKFDSDSFQPKELLDDIHDHSPKLDAMLKNIQKVDGEDMERDGHLYKHFIFCDLKSSTYGAKLLASALIANGMTMGYDALRKKPPKSPTLDKKPSASKKKRYNKIELRSEKDLDITKDSNFDLLSSVAVFDQPINVATKKQILQRFNQRPDNIHGSEIRFIIMDSGFKEGIDLFDVKYVHIFEPPVNISDQKQVIGRATRTCGQKGLTFNPTQGWPLYVFIYDLLIPTVAHSTFLNSETAFDLYLKSMNIDIRLHRFTAELEETAVYGSVDYELNREIHTFTIQKGGKEKTKPRIVVDRNLPPLIVNTLSLVGTGNNVNVNVNMGFREMREYIRTSFSTYSWPPAKMENGCTANSKDKDAANSKNKDKLMTYTPTQDFIRHYFTPQASVKGLLLYHSTGSGKTCSAIAAATSSFEPQGYTILWVTRTTLKNDIWKNMFDQVCNETIRRMIEFEGLSIPDAQAKRMKLLAKSWRIRPMSYKQFSNLVSKQNKMYDTLVKINGQVDPLRKTLLIIDEAHKLYGGGDLSSLERPNMDALHSALMNSYAMSGSESVRLLLMTATPITENPMELVQLMNLCKPLQNQMPTDFSIFSQEYLNEEGGFTADGRRSFLDNIAGNISYLNREKDARQFSQPHIKKILVPLVKDIEEVKAVDKRLVRAIALEEVNALKTQIVEETKKVENGLNDLDRTRFLGLRDRCAATDIDENKRKPCLKIANAAIRELVEEAREYTKQIREDVKEIRQEIANRRLFYKTELENVTAKLISDPEALAKFRKGIYYNLKYKCGRKIPSESVRALEKVAEESDPEVARISSELAAYDERIAQLEEGIKLGLNAHQARLKSIKDTIRTADLSDLEKSVLKMIAKDVRKTYKNTSAVSKKMTDKNIKEIRETKRVLDKDRKKAMQRFKKTVKRSLMKEKKEKKAIERAEKKLRKTMRASGELREDFKENEAVLKNLMDKYSGKIDMQLNHLSKDLEEASKIKELAKEEKRIASETKKREKMEEKQKEKEAKKLEKAEEKRIASEVKKQANETRKREKMEEKQRIKDEKTQQKLLNKTKKNRA